MPAPNDYGEIVVGHTEVLLGIPTAVELFLQRETEILADASKIAQTFEQNRANSRQWSAKSKREKRGRRPLVERSALDFATSRDREAQPQLWLALWLADSDTDGERERLRAPRRARGR
eukprot:2253601-Rhodomonas_salina.1